MIGSLTARIFAIFWLTLALVLMLVLMLPKLDSRQMTELLESEQRQGIMIEQHVEAELANDPPNDLMWWRRLFRAIDKWAPPGQRLLLVTSEGRVIGAERNEMQIIRNFIGQADNADHPQKKRYGRLEMVGPFSVRDGEDNYQLYLIRPASTSQSDFINLLFDRPLLLLIVTMLVSAPLLLWLAWSLAKPARKLKNAADEVAQGQRTHGVVGAQTHSLVDVLDGGGAGLHQTDGVVDHGDQQLVDHEAGTLSHLNGLLADVLSQLVDEVEGLLGSVHTADDLDELHAGHGVEEVHTDEGVLQAVAHLSDGQRRGVGSKHSFRLAQLVQAMEQLLLGTHLLGDALDDQIGIGSGGLLFDQHVGHESGLGALGHLALGDPLLQGSVQLFLMALGGGDAAGVHQGSVPIGGKNLGDTTTHGAGAENCNLHSVSS